MSADNQTFGKGSGQLLEPVGDGAVRLTYFYFSTPGGSPHIGGVKPDIKVELSEAARPKLEDGENLAESIEGSMPNLLPAEASLLRKDPPPAKVCRVAPDRDGAHYSIDRAALLTSKDAVDETYACALEMLAGISERAAVTPSPAVSGPKEPAL
jgi:hypothetical protein